MSDATERLWALLEPHLAEEGVELDDLSVVGRGRGTVLRVTVDAEGGGLGLDRIAEISREISRLLDREDPIPGSYTLEVTSPGLERNLRRPSHYRKAEGREVVVKTTHPVDGEKVHRGVLAQSDQEGFTVELDGDGRRRIGFEAVASARTVFRWERSGKPR